MIAPQQKPRRTAPPREFGVHASACVAGTTALIAGQRTLKRELPTASPAPRNFPPPRAFTLIDLLIALSITVMIGGTVAAMIQAVAQGTTGAMDGRRHLVRLEGLQAQLNDLIHSSRCILAAGNGYVVYWSNDNNCDMAAQLSELEMIELDTTANQLDHYTFAPASPGQDYTYPSNTSWYTAVEAAKTGPSAVMSILAINVTQFNVTLDSSNPGAHMASMTVSLTDQGATSSGSIGCAARAYQLPQ